MTQDKIKQMLYDYMPEIVAGISIVILILVLILRWGDFSSEILISALLGSCGIVLIGIERRAKHFDRIVSICVILFLAVSFTFI